MYSKKKDIKPQPPQQQNIGYVQRTAGGIGQYRNIPQLEHLEITNLDFSLQYARAWDMKSIG